MRAIAFQIICFIYIFSTSVFIVDETILQYTTIKPMSVTGEELNVSQLMSGGSDGAENPFTTIREDSLNLERDGNIFDRITDFASSGYNAVWLVLEVLSGSYGFWVMHAVGVPAVFIYVFQVMFGIFVVAQVIWYVTGRY